LEGDMAMARILSIRERTSADGAAVLAVAGELELSTAPLLTSEVEGALSRHPSELVLDLRGVELIDSSGAGALIGCRRRCVRMGARLILVVADGPVQRFMRRLHLEPLFDVVDTRIAA
jgi:anti-sigma B factor antagonist